jgi:uncharacterized membrane protein
MPKQQANQFPLASTLERNIEELVAHRKARGNAQSVQDRIADSVTAFAGRMLFVYIHAVVYGFWILANVGLIPGVPAWDPSLVVLAMVASVEAIFLSTFILISQNRMAAAEDQRSELNLQINLLAEHEVTRIVQIVSDIATKLGVEINRDELDELKKDVAPGPVLQRIEEAAKEEETDSSADLPHRQQGTA